MRKLLVVFDGGHGLYIRVHVLAFSPRDAKVVAQLVIEQRAPQYSGTLDGVPTRFYDAEDDPSFKHGNIAIGANGVKQP